MTINRVFLALCLVVVASTAWAQNFGSRWNLNNKGENWNFQIVALGGSTGGGLNSNDPTLSTASTLVPGGPSVGDVIISACYCTDTAAPATCAQTGPTGITNLTNTTTTAGRQTVYQTVVTMANKGTGVTCTNPGSNSGGTTATQVLFRGVDPVLGPTDATTTTSGPTTSANPDPASITTVRDSAAVVAICSSSISDTTPGDVSGYATATPGKQTLNQTDTAPGTTAMTWVLKAAAGAEDPGAFSSWTSAAWVCSTVALRPWR
jgi:hypothetical protein